MHSSEGADQLNTQKQESEAELVNNGETSKGEEVVHGHLAIPPTSPPIAEETTGEAIAPPAEVEKEVQLAALTFDDGPDLKYTTAILDILKEKDVKATFFVVGQQVKKYPEVLKRMVDEGHAIGNHSYHHKDMTKLNEQQIVHEMDTTDVLMKEAVGFTPELFRAPYGAVSSKLKEVLKKHERELVGWTVDTRDWAGTATQDMRALIRKELRPGGIILMHSFGGKHIKNTVEALPDIIDDLKAMEYTLVTVDELN